MSFDVSGLSRLPVSTGILYFLKYVFLAAVLGFVYYVVKDIIASLRSASEEGRAAWQRSSDTGAAVLPSGQLRRGRLSLSDADSIAADCTVAHKSGHVQGKSAGTQASLAELPPEPEELPTFSSLQAAVESFGFIEVISGAATKVKRIPIEKDDVTFGRARDCTIQIRDGFTSAHHAKISADQDGVYLEDTGSRNGTFIDEQRIEEAVALADGDVFTVGDAVFRYSRF